MESYTVKIISRKFAITHGLNKYFTGKPCKRGHFAERIVVSCNCTDCADLFRKSAVGKESAKKSWKKIYSSRKKQIQARQRAWANKNKKRVSAKRRAHYLNNYARDRRLQDIYRKNNPDKISTAKRNYSARKMGAIGVHNKSDIDRIMILQNFLCSSCYVPISSRPTPLQKKMHVDHKTPLSRGGSNGPNNLQCLCATCNLSKHDSTQEEWAAKQAWRVQ